MANVEGKFYRGETQRRGVTPVSPPNADDDPQDPLNPPGAGNTTTYKQLGDTIDKSFVGKNGYVPIVTDENALTLQPNIPNTGVAVFGGVVYNSTTTVDIGIVKGYIVDNETDPLVSSVQYIEYAGATGVTVTTVGSGTRSYALLKIDGTIHFQNTYPTSEDRKQMIYLFKVGHPSGVITVVANEPDFVLSPLQQFRDLFQAFNYVNEGVYAYADAADLTFNTSAGLIVGNGINFVPEPDNPNILTVAATTPCTFVYRTQTGAGGIPVTNIEPNNYDNAGTITTIGGGANRSTVQYIHYSPNLGFVIQYGQTIYDNLVDAIASIGKETHVVYENLIRDAILIGVLALTRSTTDLTDTNDARFFRADIFGQLVGSAAGTSVTTLQRAYLNSLIPQIETVSGELAIKNGGAADTDVVFAIRSLLDVDNIQMYGDGRIRHSDAVNADESATLGQVIDLALGDGLISGGIVQWTGTGYNFDVSTAFARFKGVYTLISLPDTLTLTTPDATNDRIDLFILQILFDVDGIPTGMEADFITGTPAANPVKPQINPETQIELTQVLVDAGSTTPTLTEEVIYDQNTEWTGTSSGTGTAVFNSAVDPYQGSISVETTNIQNGFYIQFNNGAEIDISTYQTIGFHIKLKASLGANQNLYLTFLDGSLAPVSNFVLVNLDKSLLTYQFVGIALNAVNFTSSDVQYIRVSFVRTSGSTTFSGYFFDVFKLEGGIAPTVTNSDHNQLLGLQGGNATERYHLTEVEHQRVQDFSPYDLAQEGATNNQVLTWVSANSRFEPVTPAGGGGTDSNAVHYNVADGKTASEKQQARDNIGSIAGIPQIIATTGTINDLAYTSNILIFTGASAITLTGLVAGTDGEEVSIVNYSSAILTIAALTSSSGNNQIRGSALIQRFGQSVTLKYRQALNKWIIKEGFWYSDTSSGFQSLANVGIKGQSEANISLVIAQNSDVNKYVVRDSTGAIISRVYDSGHFEHTKTSSFGGASSSSLWTVVFRSLSASGGSALFYSFAGVLLARVWDDGTIEHIRSNQFNKSLRRDEQVLLYPVTVITAGTINDYAEAAGNFNYYFTAATQINGFASGENGKMKVIQNKNTVDCILGHENAGSVAANRLKIIGGADLTVPADGIVTLIYEAGTVNRWKLHSKNF